MVRKLAITDARKAYPDASKRMLASIAKQVGMVCLVAFVGDSRGAKASVWAGGRREQEALEVWTEATLRSFQGLGLHRTALTHFGKGCCVLVGVESGGKAHCETWSVTKADCDGMKGWAAAHMWPAFSVAPFRTHFGWGTGGVPTPLTQAELDTLTPSQAAWIARNFP